MAHTIDRPAVFSISEVASVLGIHPMSVRRRIADGSIGAIRVGRLYRVPAAELERILATPWRATTTPDVRGDP